MVALWIFSCNVIYVSENFYCLLICLLSNRSLLSVWYGRHSGAAEPIRQGRKIPTLKVGRKVYIFCPTFDDLMSPKCTKLHRFPPMCSTIFQGDTPDPQNWEVSHFPDSSPSTKAHRPTFSELPWPLPSFMSSWLHLLITSQKGSSILWTVVVIA